MSSLPTDQQIDQFLTNELDRPEPQGGRGWRWRALGGHTLTDIMATAPVSKNVRACIPLTWWPKLRDHLEQHQLTQSAFLRELIRRELDLPDD